MLKKLICHETFSGDKKNTPKTYVNNGKATLKNSVKRTLKNAWKRRSSSLYLRHYSFSTIEYSRSYRECAIQFFSVSLHGKWF